MDNATATKPETTDAAPTHAGAFMKIISIKTELIDPSPFQNRQSFGGPQDDELADAIATRGILSPIQVRPGKKVGRFELIFGERRVRAAKKIKLAEVPAQVVDVTDEEAAERLLVENLQRRDLTALEEAEGYRRLLDNHEHDMDSLANTTHKSKAHLYGRLKLLELAAGPKKALAAGELPQQHAELIARIGDAKLQEQCTRIVLGKLDRAEDQPLLDEMVDIRHETLGEEGKYANHDNTSVLSFRATQALIRRYFTTRLATAKFEPTDATLVPAAGACSTCPHRSGNQPGLPGMLGADDLCTLASCYANKTKAQFDRQAAAFKAAGHEVISKKEAADDIFASDGVTVMQERSAYVEATTTLPYEITAANDAATKAKTWGKLLGKDYATVPKVLVQDASGAAREMIDVDAAKKILIESGKLEDPKAKKPKPSTPSNLAADQRIGGLGQVRRLDKKEHDRRELAKLAIPRMLGMVAEGAAKLAESKETAAWRWIAHQVVAFGGDADMMNRRGIKNGQLHDYIDKLKSAADLRSILVEHLVAELMDSATGPHAHKPSVEEFDEACRLFNADYDKALALAKAARDAEDKVDAKKKAEPKPAKAKKASKK